MRQIRVLNEEISRWAFEILYKQNTKWKIAFTNPTAGPWKTIKGFDSKGNEGEVYRFPLEETRPDIIMYNDELKAIIIIEAKDSLKKLIAGDQSEKSVEVAERLAGVLSNLGRNPFWAKRATYQTYMGLLWGSLEMSESDADMDEVFDEYYNNAKAHTCLNKDLIIGVESLFKDGKITCSFKYKTYAPGKDVLCRTIIDSLK